MNDVINKIFNFLQSKNYEVITSGNIKKTNGKKIIPPLEFYREYMQDLLEFTPQDFTIAIKDISSNKKEESVNLSSTFSELLSHCGFIYEKFRWVVTKEKTKVYYLKVKKEAEEYFHLTTDRESPKFFNSLSFNEMDKLNKLTAEYNTLNPEDKTDEEKVIKAIISDIRRNPAYGLPKEPVTLSNDPNEPCFKFVDIEGLERWGDEYVVKHNRRPPTPAWDCFFVRIRDQSMVELTKAYLAGLFVAKNSTKQALYIYGNGNDGKSQVTECLAVKMGEEATFMLPQSMKSNQFTMIDAYGKRMFIGEELQSPNVIKNGMLHAILGGSRVRLEPKGEAAFSGRVYACGVITSNYAPQIDDVKNQTSRILYIEMNPPSDEEINQSGKEWSQALQDEFSAMLYQGYKFFKKLNPSGASFILPNNYSDKLDDLFDEKSKQIRAFIEEGVVPDNESHIKCVLGEAFISFVKDKFFDENDLSVPNEYRDSRVGKEIFEKLLMKFPKIYKTSIRVDGKKIKVIKGLSINQKCRSIIRHFK